MNKMTSKSIFSFIASSCLILLSSCSSNTEVKSIAELLAATKNPKAHSIRISANLENVPTFRLAPGQKLQGINDQTIIKFANNNDGIQLSSNNEVSHINLEATPTKRAIFNDAHVDNLGKIKLKNITAIGQVQILVRDKIRQGNVIVDGLDIITADTYSQTMKPKAYGMQIAQGAFTLWNLQADKNVIIKANLENIAIGRPNAGVKASGVLISGNDFENGGQIDLAMLGTNAIYINEDNQTTGAIFISYGTQAKKIINAGPITTYGINDVALTNWGSVDKWIVEEKIISHGSNSVGFMNFGKIKTLTIKAPIETFGEGSRGFNAYDGHVDTAEFDHIVTHDDGAIGIQINNSINHLIVNDGIETFGSASQPQAKGGVKKLSAAGISVKKGGIVNEIEIHGGIITHGKDISPIELYGGEIEKMQIEGEVKALGNK